MKIKLPAVSALVLKVVACIFMLAGSIGTIILKIGIINIDQYTTRELYEAMDASKVLNVEFFLSMMLEIVGSIAIPIFALFTVEGFVKSASRTKYFFTVVLFAALSEIPFDFAYHNSLFDISEQNPMWAVAGSLLMLYLMRKADKIGADADEFVPTTKEDRVYVQSKKTFKKLCRYLVQFVILVVFTVAIGFYLHINYGITFFLVVGLFYIFRNHLGWKLLTTALALFLCSQIGEGSYLYFAMLAFYRVYCYDPAERNFGKKKYVFYAIYPAHILLFGIIARICLR